MKITKQTKVPTVWLHLDDVLEYQTNLTGN